MGNLKIDALDPDREFEAADPESLISVDRGDLVQNYAWSLENGKNSAEFTDFINRNLAQHEDCGAVQLLPETSSIVGRYFEFRKSCFATINEDYEGFSGQDVDYPNTLFVACTVGDQIVAGGRMIVKFPGQPEPLPLEAKLRSTEATVRMNNLAQLVTIHEQRVYNFSNLDELIPDYRNSTIIQQGGECGISGYGTKMRNLKLQLAAKGISANASIAALALSPKKTTEETYALYSEAAKNLDGIPVHLESRPDVIMPGYMSKTGKQGNVLNVLFFLKNKYIAH